MMELEGIIKTMENKIDSDDFEVVMTDCMETVESDYNELSSIEPLLQLMERHPLTSFGSPGPIVHFVETFYKKGYEEKLISSLKRMPTVHTVWMLHRIINGTEHLEHYLSILKQISEDESYHKEVRDMALEFLSIHE